MRVASRLVLALLLALVSTACGGGDLTLPGAGDPASLTIFSGNGQLGPQGATLTDPLTVEVLDGIGRPVPGATVLFRFTDDVPDAGLDPSTSPTDGQGHASALARLGMRAGAQPIEAAVAVPGQDLRVRFDLTALPKDNGGSVPPPDPGAGGGGGGGGGGGAGGGGGTGGGGTGGGGGGGASHDGGGGGGGSHDGGGGHGGDGGGHDHGKGQGGDTGKGGHDKG